MVRGGGWYIGRDRLDDKYGEEFDWKSRDCWNEGGGTFIHGRTVERIGRRQTMLFSI